MSVLQWFSDNPIEISYEDELSYKDSAEMLANIIYVSEGPLSMGIYGEWGSGKTSLMKLIMEKLDGTEIKVSWFDTWNYANEEEIWRVLMLSLIDDLDPKNDMSRDVVKIISSILNLGIITSKAVLTKGSNLYSDRVEFITNILNLFNSKNSRRESIVRDRLRTIKEFREKFGELVYKKVGDNGKFVVFIDDLDRIEPNKVIQTIEAIKIFLCCEKCIFVIGCDYTYLNDCIEYKYEKMKICGKDYIDKIIQVPFQLPRITDHQFSLFIKPYVNKVLNDTTKLDQAVELITKSIDKNPRKLKRRINSFSLISQISNCDIDEILLLKLFCFSERWPNVYKRTVDAFYEDTNEFFKLENWVFPILSSEEYYGQDSYGEDDEYVPDPYEEYLGQKQIHMSDIEKDFSREFNSEIEIQNTEKHELKEFLKVRPSLSRIERSILITHLARIEKINLDLETAKKIRYNPLKNLKSGL